MKEIKSGKLVAHCENETGLKPMQSHTGIDFQWLDEGIYNGYWRYLV